MNVIHELFGTSLWSSVVLVISILLMETLLSIDNAAVLAILVKKLPEAQQPKALEYGILGAFVLRFGSLFIVSLLAQFWFIKVIGGVYLIYLAYAHFTKEEDSIEETTDPDDSAIYKFFHKYLGVFWSTVALVECMDMVFSLDNIFAVTAMTKYYGLICVAVGIGIVSMRFVSVQFIKLMKIMPFLENLAFIVIGFLGVKLAITIFEHWWLNDTAVMKALASEKADHIMSYISLAIFVIPILSCLLLGYPKKNVATPEETTIIDAAEEAVN